jgi:hypothetical protein
MQKDRLSMGNSEDWSEVKGRQMDGSREKAKKGQRRTAGTN